MTYGILAWGRHTNAIHKIQKRAIRIIAASKYNTHTVPLFKQLHLLKACDICKSQELKFYHKLINRQLPKYFERFVYQTNSRNIDTVWSATAAAVSLLPAQLCGRTADPSERVPIVPVIQCQTKNSPLPPSLQRPCVVLVTFVHFQLFYLLCILMPFYCVM